MPLRRRHPAVQTRSDGPEGEAVGRVPVIGEPVEVVRRARRQRSRGRPRRPPRPTRRPPPGRVRRDRRHETVVSHSRRRPGRATRGTSGRHPGGAARCPPRSRSRTPCVPSRRGRIAHRSHTPRPARQRRDRAPRRGSSWSWGSVVEDDRDGIRGRTVCLATQVAGTRTAVLPHHTTVELAPRASATVMHPLRGSGGIGRRGRIQVPVSERTWGFKSPLPHQATGPSWCPADRSVG